MADRLQDELTNLRALRDEVKVQMHLAKLEARESFERLEKRWSHLEAQARALGEAAREDRAEIRRAAERIAAELREAYRKLKARL